MTDAQRLERIVGHQDDGTAGEQPPRQVLQLKPRHGIEMGERLVHQDHRPVLAQCTGERGALAHAAGQDVRQIVEAVMQPDLGEQAACARSGRLQRRCVAPQTVAQQHVVEHREPGQEQIGLGHVGNGLAAFRAGQQAGQPAQQGGLADATAAQQAGGEAGGKLEREIVGHDAVAEGDARVPHEKRRSSQHETHPSLRRY